MTWMRPDLCAELSVPILETYHHPWALCSSESPTVASGASRCRGWGGGGGSGGSWYFESGDSGAAGRRGCSLRGGEVTRTPRSEPRSRGVCDSRFRARGGPSAGRFAHRCSLIRSAATLFGNVPGDAIAFQLGTDANLLPENSGKHCGRGFRGYFVFTGMAESDSEDDDDEIVIVGEKGNGDGDGEARRGALWAQAKEETELESERELKRKRHKEEEEARRRAEQEETERRRRARENERRKRVVWWAAWCCLRAHGARARRGSGTDT